jgi:endogenous inhibitor of DNA gyrase (YacG/DUF329 family)
MSKKIIVPAAGSCPNCGNPVLNVPIDYMPETHIACPECQHQAPWKDFFKSEPSP